MVTGPTRRTITASLVSSDHELGRAACARPIARVQGCGRTACAGSDPAPRSAGMSGVTKRDAM